MASITNIQREGVGYYFAGIIIIATLSTLVGLMAAKQANLLTILANIAPHVWALRFLRWLIIGTVLLLWPYGVERLGNKIITKDSLPHFWKREIVQAAMWLILFVLLLNQHTLFRLIHLV